MYKAVLGLVVAAVVATGPFAGVSAQETQTVQQVNTVATVKPNYLPPSEILQFLGVSSHEGVQHLEWGTPDKWHVVQVRHNDAANLLILTGPSADVDYAKSLIGHADIAPRQIGIEVKIIEVNTSKARDVGFDWEAILETSYPRATWNYREDNDERSGTSGSPYDNKAISRDYSASAQFNLADVLELLDESGAGSVHNAPRILTLNNRRATILDGQRVTYITRYSSYTNLFETDSLDAGLTLSVVPSLGESGYITLQITAELTTLGSSISGSPVKSGQMLENTIVVKDGESVVLGGFTRKVESRVHKRFPLLGHILPVLFSREITNQETIQSTLILTPRVVDFGSLSNWDAGFEGAAEQTEGN